MLKVIATGDLSEDPKGDERYTVFKMRIGGRSVALFNQTSAMESRAEYRSGARIRGEGTGEWKEFRDEFTLQVNGAGIDGSDAEEDSLEIRVDGSVNHELNVEKDDESEGGGRYIAVEIEAPTRGRDSQGNWGDQISYVRAMVLGNAVDQLLDLDKKGVTFLRFIGDLLPEPRFLRGTPIYYAEITKVEAAQGRGGGDDDSFWASKPMGLAKRNAKAKAATKGKGGNYAPAKKRGGPVDPDLDDSMPF